MKKLTILCAAAALAAILAACSDGGTPDSAGDNMNPPIAGDSRPEGGGSGVAGGGSTGNENGTGDADTPSLSERLAQDGAEVSLGNYQLEDGSTYTVAGRNVTVSGGNADGASFVVKADGATFINVRGIGSLVVDKEVGEGDFSAEGCEVSTMLVNGGGANSVHIVGGKMGDILVLKETVRIALSGKFDEPVKGIYSLAGEFKGTIDTKDASSLKIEKADAKIAAKAEGADIEDKDAAVPPEAMEAVREFSPEAVDILNGRAFVRRYDRDDCYVYYYFEDGTYYLFSSETEKTLPEIKEAAQNSNDPYATFKYKIAGGKLEFLEKILESGEIIPNQRMKFDVTDEGIVITNSYYYASYETQDEHYIKSIGIDGNILFWLQINEINETYYYTFFVRDEAFLNNTPENSGTIPFTVQKMKSTWNSITDAYEHTVISDWGLQAVTAQYTVTGGDIGSEGSAMTLEFELEGRTYNLSGTLTTEITNMTEVTE